MKKTFIAYTDGGARGNPGPAAAAAVIMDGQQNLVSKKTKFLGTATNNIAEYAGLILALTEIAKMHQPNLTGVVCYMDSELIVRQMIGQYKVREVGLQQKWAQAQALVETFDKVEFVHVKREFNKLADSLVNETLDRHL